MQAKLVIENRRTREIRQKQLKEMDSVNMQRRISKNTLDEELQAAENTDKQIVELPVIVKGNFKLVFKMQRMSVVLLKQ